MSRKSRKSRKPRNPAARVKPAKPRRSRPAPPPAPRVQEVPPVSKSKGSSRRRSSSKPSKPSKPARKARARRGFANVSAFSKVAPAGMVTQAAGGLAGFVGTGYAVSMIARQAAKNPTGMLAKLGEGRFVPVATRAVLALAAGWALRRFVSKPIGNAVAVGGLINAGASLAARTMGQATGQVPLLGISDPAGIDHLHPERDTSQPLGELSDGDVQAVLEAARTDAGMGDIPANFDEANLTPAAVDQIIRAA